MYSVEFQGANIYSRSLDGLRLQPNVTPLHQIVTDRCALSNCHILIFQFSASVTLTIPSISSPELPV